MKKAEFGNPANLVGGIGWKGTGIIILVLIIVGNIYRIITGC